MKLEIQLMKQEELFFVFNLYELASGHHVG